MIHQISINSISADKRREQSDVAAQVAAFKARGGKIKQCETRRVDVKDLNTVKDLQRHTWLLRKEQMLINGSKFL